MVDSSQWASLTGVTPVKQKVQVDGIMGLQRPNILQQFPFMLYQVSMKRNILRENNDKLNEKQNYSDCLHHLGVQLKKQQHNKSNKSCFNTELFASSSQLSKAALQIVYSLADCAEQEFFLQSNAEQINVFRLQTN